MTTEAKIGLNRGDGGSQWGLFDVVKTHFETITLYPILVGIGFIRNPRGVLEELRTKGFKPSYKELFANNAEMSLHWRPNE